MSVKFLLRLVEVLAREAAAKQRAVLAKNDILVSDIYFDLLSANVIMYQASVSAVEERDSYKLKLHWDFCNVRPLQNIAADSCLTLLQARVLLAVKYNLRLTLTNSVVRFMIRMLELYCWRYKATR